MNHHTTEVPHKVPPSKKSLRYWRKRIFEIIEIGAPEDYPSRIYDFFNLFTIVINLMVGTMYTFNSMEAKYGPLLLKIESFTVAFFAIDYTLRLLTAKHLRPKKSERVALLCYIFSFTGIVDMLSFLPYYLPIFFPSGAVAFRMFRVMRIFRLFRITAYYDSVNVIAEVISSKKQQLLSSVFIILVLMFASSLCMYSLENTAQPDVFSNAFSGIWWSVSTLLTVGYGDIYPITTAGKLFGIVITFLGVGMVAIPTGIISAGFVEQYSRIKRINEYSNESDVHFIKVKLVPKDAWVGKAVRDLGLPHGTILAVIQRGKGVLAPRGEVELKANDTLIIGAESMGDDSLIDLKEVHLRKQHIWNGHQIRDLDLSRQTIIVMVKRRNRVLIPNGNLVLLEGDRVILYTQKHVSHAKHIEV